MPAGRIGGARVEHGGLPRRLRRLALAAALSLAHPAAAEAERTALDLRALSIEELSQIDVTSVTKSSGALGTSPAAVYVISRTDIARSGHATLPEILRLAPNLHVARTGAGSYAITARGLNGSPQAQAFSNKLLVLIDGRSVYSPLYSGVYWDLQEVLPQDIERIEVISGPGATLWGANAVNGVINIITRSAADSRGALVSASLGTFERTAAARYGGALGEGLDYRVYARLVDVGSTRTAAGADAGDDWQRLQLGFRMDWTPTAQDVLTLQGDLQRGQLTESDSRSGNIIGRWSRRWSERSSLQVQASYDRVNLGAQGDGLQFVQDSYDISLQQALAVANHEILLGGGLRYIDYTITGRPDFFFDPPGRTLRVANAFVQDSISLSKALRLIVGLKLEDNAYTGAELLPNVRLAWSATPASFFWASVARAVRSPTPFDRDVVEKLGEVTFLVGGPEFQPETLIAYEAGARFQLTPGASLSVSGFINDYDRLRNIEVAPGGFLPLRWGNGLKARTYGIEAWGDVRLLPWWRLKAALAWLEVDGRFAPGATTLLGTAQLGNDPAIRASLRSAMNPAPRLTFDAELRYTSVLPEPRVPPQLALDARLAWQLSEQLQLAVTGRNLLKAWQREYSPNRDNRIPRSVAAEVEWRF